MRQEGIGMGEFVPGRAKDYFRLDIYDAQKCHVVSLQLRRDKEMTVEDMGQLQNFLWTQVGLAIRDDKSLQERLKLGGIEVLTEDPAAPTAAPGA